MDGLGGTGLGHEVITVSTGAVTFASLPTNANAALIRCETNNIRISLDSTAPTSAIGIPLLATDVAPFWLMGRAVLLNFKAIRSGGADGTLQVSYFAV